MATQEPDRPVPAQAARWSRALPVIAGVALLAVVPACVFGFPEGHDFSYHLLTWMDNPLRVLLGAWAPLANFGFGEPRFIFYPPLPALLGSAIWSVLPPNAVPETYAFLTLALAGTAMFALARQWFPPAHAVAAAVFYAVNPYFLLCLYQRSTFPELLANAFCPWLLLFAVRSGENSRALAPLAVVLAAFWISDLPAAVLATYALAWLIVVGAVWRRSWRALVRGAISVSLGLALAAFYILPAAYEQRWVNVSDAFLPSRPQNWRLSWVVDPIWQLAWFTVIVSTIVVVQVVLAAVAAGFSWRWGRERGAAWGMVIALAGVSTFMLLPPASNVVWEYLPKLEFVQFPWRCLALQTLCLVVLTTAALARYRVRWLIITAGALVLAAGAASGVSASYAPGFPAILRNTARVYGGYIGDTKFMPLNADAEVLWAAHNMPEALVTMPNAAIRVLRWEAESATLLIHSPAPTEVVLRRMTYPAWRVTVNGQPVAAGSDSFARLTFLAPAGSSRAEVSFVRTPDRLVGDAISALAVLLVAGILFAGARKPGFLPPEAQESSALRGAGDGPEWRQNPLAPAGDEESCQD